MPALSHGGELVAEKPKSHLSVSTAAACLRGLTWRSCAGIAAPALIQALKHHFPGCGVSTAAACLRGLSWRSCAEIAAIALIQALTRKFSVCGDRGVTGFLAVAGALSRWRTRRRKAQVSPVGFNGCGMPQWIQFRCPHQGTQPKFPGLRQVSHTELIADKPKCHLRPGWRCSRSPHTAQSAGLVHPNERYQKWTKNDLIHALTRNLT